MSGYTPDLRTGGALPALASATPSAAPAFAGLEGRVATLLNVPVGFVPPAMISAVVQAMREPMASQVQAAEARCEELELLTSPYPRADSLWRVMVDSILDTAPTFGPDLAPAN